MGEAPGAEEDRRGEPFVGRAGELLTRILAATYRTCGVLVNAVDPGWVRTDMGGPSAPRSIEEGVDTTVWLATLPDEGPTGGYFRDRRSIEW